MRCAVGTSITVSQIPCQCVPAGIRFVLDAPVVVVNHQADIARRDVGRPGHVPADAHRDDQKQHKRQREQAEEAEQSRPSRNLRHIWHGRRVFEGRHRLLSFSAESDALCMQ